MTDFYINNGLVFFPPGTLAELIKREKAKEREACAVLCETSDRHRGTYFADKIRARGEK